MRGRCSDSDIPLNPAHGAEDDGRPPRVGLLAGWGRFPVVVAETLARQGFQTYCIGVRGYADPVLAEVCHDFHGAEYSTPARRTENAPPPAHGVGAHLRVRPIQGRHTGRPLRRARPIRAAKLR